jgi:hypothetical protein
MASRSGISVLLLALSGALTAPATAGEREFMLRWEPPPASVDGFRVHVGASSGDYTETLDLGFVSADSDGIGRFPIFLVDDRDSYIAMTAYNAEGESDLSNEIQVQAPCNPGACAEPEVGGDPDRGAIVMTPIIDYLLNDTP